MARRRKTFRYPGTGSAKQSGAATYSLLHSSPVTIRIVVGKAGATPGGAANYSRVGAPPPMTGVRGIISWLVLEVPSGTPAPTPTGGRDIGCWERA